MIADEFLPRQSAGFLSGFSRAMQSPNVLHQPVNHVFVDIENVKDIDAAVVAGKNLTFHFFNGPVKPEVEPKIAVAKALSEKAEKLMVDLKKVAASRPKRKKGLLGRASSVLGKESTEAKCEALVQELMKAGKLTVDEKGAVSYSL